MTDAELFEMLADDPTKLMDQEWRLTSGLYKIMTKDHGLQPFVPTAVQLEFYNNMAHRNVALKARQVGLTTWCCVYTLDCAMFYAGTRAGIIAHTQDDASEIFRSKVKTAYSNLPPFIKTVFGCGEAATPLGNFKQNETELILNNGSSIRVGTTLRSSTLDILHVSEFGKIAARYPDKAIEIMTGSLQTVPASGTVLFESTAEGYAGEFFDLCEVARSNNNIAKAENRAMDPKEFKFHFTAWHDNPEYQTNPEHVTITPDHEKYFKELEEKWGIVVNAQQKAWYVLTETNLKGDLIRREYPSHPDEAFANSDEGTFYGTLMRQAEEEGRISDDVLWNSNWPVEVSFDIGWSDQMACIFYQTNPDTRSVNIIDYHEANETTINEFARIIAKKPYRYARFIGPHDSQITDPFGDGRTRAERAEAAGLKPWVTVGMSIKVVDQIDIVRNLLPRCRFHKTKAARIIECLKKYSKKWDRSNSTWSGEAKHDQYSHGADAFRCFAAAPTYVPTSEKIGWDDEVQKQTKLPNW